MVMVKKREKGCCEYLIYDRDAQNRHTDRLYRPHAASTQRNKKKLNINFPVFEGGKK